jgi:hypothetical protein
MNSRNLTDDVFDLSLDRSLKNWVVRKNPPADGRAKLLKAAVQQERPFPRVKLRKINFEWFFNLNEIRCEHQIRPIDNHLFEQMDFLTTTMAFL